MLLERKEFVEKEKVKNIIERGSHRLYQVPGRQHTNTNSVVSWNHPHEFSRLIMEG